MSERHSWQVQGWPKARTLCQLFCKWSPSLRYKKTTKAGGKHQAIEQANFWMAGEEEAHCFGSRNRKTCTTGSSWQFALCVGYVQPMGEGWQNCYVPFQWRIAQCLARKLCIAHCYWEAQQSRKSNGSSKRHVPHLYIAAQEHLSRCREKEDSTVRVRTQTKSAHILMIKLMIWRSTYK